MSADLLKIDTYSPFLHGLEGLGDIGRTRSAPGVAARIAAAFDYEQPTLWGSDALFDLGKTIEAGIAQSDMTDDDAVEEELNAAGSRIGSLVVDSGLYGPVERIYSSGREPERQADIAIVPGGAGAAELARRSARLGAMVTAGWEFRQVLVVASRQHPPTVGSTQVSEKDYAAGIIDEIRGEFGIPGTCVTVAKTDNVMRAAARQLGPLLGRPEENLPSIALVSGAGVWPVEAESFRQLAGYTYDQSPGYGFFDRILPLPPGGSRKKNDAYEQLAVVSADGPEPGRPRAYRDVMRIIHSLSALAQTADEGSPERWHRLNGKVISGAGQ